MITGIGRERLEVRLLPRSGTGCGNITRMLDSCLTVSENEVTEEPRVTTKEVYWRSESKQKLLLPKGTAEEVDREHSLSRDFYRT